MAPAPRPLRFILVGAWNTLFGYLAFVGCVAATRAVGISYLYATVPAQILAVLNAYVAHRTWTFADGDKSFGAFLRFNTVYWVLFVVNVGLLAALVDGVGLVPEVAQLGLTVLTVAASYLAHGRWTFRVPGASGDGL